jgi:hypothetical protein
LNPRVPGQGAAVGVSLFPRDHSTRPLLDEKDIIEATQIRDESEIICVPVPFYSYRPIYILFCRNNNAAVQVIKIPAELLK